MGKRAIIIGAGPAGLTAAYELLKRTDIKPVILEKSGDIGGISKTINYKGNRMDIGGHRFFSKSDRVMNWWLNIMPLEKTEEETVTINYQNKTHSIYSNTNEGTGAHEKPGLVMLIRKRLSRIYFLRQFFNYPIQLSIDTLRKLGFVRTIRILLSYLAAQLIPRKPEKSLEDFLINRFGRQLYLLFFKDYTEKVWGVPCNEISAEWGAQRIKGVSISSAIKHAAQAIVKKKKGSHDIAQKDTETSLIEKFLYPALGPGQLWEEVARQIEVMGGSIVHYQDVKEIRFKASAFPEGSADKQGTRDKEQDALQQITSVKAINTLTDEILEYQGDYFFSTMPVQELIAGMNGEVPDDVKEIAAGLQYRDFITVGVLLNQLGISDSKTGETKTLDLKDTWIYIQERDVKVGRLQLFNNWSPFMVNEPGKAWVGMEYFCNKDDEFWNMSDEDIKRTAIGELEKMGLAQVGDVLDSTVHREEKTYPAYFGTYSQFDKIRHYVDQFENLFLVGRNGMHKYNNSDHSMLTAMVSVDNICEGITSKENIWAINTEQVYHEEKIEKMNTQERSRVIQEISFRNFIFRENKTYLILWAVAIIIQFCLFKYFYPFAGFISGDSYVYIRAAQENLTINTFPVGYSNFLRLFSVFTKSDLALVTFQFLFIQASILLLLLTLFYFFKPGKTVQIILLCAVILNPVFLYVSNYVTSDALFLALSFIWFSLVLWNIHRPSLNLILWHTLVLYFAFTVRYNAIIYPMISILSFILSYQKARMKIIGASCSVILIALFILYTGNNYKNLTNTWQFSPFSGWQMANNAMQGYRHIESNKRKAVPKQYRELDAMARNFIDTTRDVNKYFMENLEANTYYMWAAKSPFQLYKANYVKIDSTDNRKGSNAVSFKQWAIAAPQIGGYGRWLIKNYPYSFIEYYLWPNTKKYFAPPTEFLSVYNMGLDTIAQQAQDWFGYKSMKVRTRLKSHDVYVLDSFPILLGGINAIFIASFFCFLLLGKVETDNLLKRGGLIAASFWLLNFGFSVFASPIALRFQLFSSVIYLFFGILLLEHVYKAAFKPLEKGELDVTYKSVIATEA